MPASRRGYARYARLFGGSALGGIALALAAPAAAQTAPPPAPDDRPPASTGSNVSGPVGIDQQGATAQPASPAAPSTDDQDSGRGLSDIVVTARRVDENLQRVPISVGTLDPAALSNRGITGLGDLKGAIAGLTTSKITTPGGSYITIRGKTGSAVPTPSSDSAVGFYIDGVYIARGQGAGTAIPDIARVEVLRGPQGTLFGRNNSAGAINFLTNDPTQRPELQFNVLYGNYDEVRASAIVNLPVTSTLAVRVSYLHEQYDGDVVNTTTSPGYDIRGYGAFRPAPAMGSSNTESVIAKARWTGIPGLTLDYKFDYVNVLTSPPPNQIIGFAPSALAPTLAALLPVQPAGFVTPSFTRLGALAEDFHSLSKIENSGHLIVANYDVNDALSAKSITSWRSSSSGGFFDLDGGDWQIFIPPTFSPASFCVNCNRNAMSQHQFTQELQLIGQYDRASFIAGLYYFNERADFRTLFPLATVIPEAPAVYVPPTTPFVGAGLGPLALAEDGFYRNRSYAGYVHGDYEFTDRLKLSVGGRYTIDKRFSTDRRPFALSRASAEYKQFSYDAALNYQITPEVLVFGKYANGYVSGGVYKGLRFDPETLKQAEIGFKSEFWDRRIRLNGSIYYSWIDDKQTAVPSTNPAANPVLAAAGFSAPFPLGVITYNIAGQSTIRGLEVEAMVRPVPPLTLTANIGYNDPKDADGGLPRAPKTSFSFSGQYDLPKFGNGMFLSLRVDGDYRGAYYGTGLTAATSLVGEVPAALRPGFATSAAYFDRLRDVTVAGNYWLVNGRVSLLDIPMDGPTAKLSGYVRNIFDEDGLLTVVNYGGTIGGAFERPRTYGLELNLSF